MDNKNSKSNSYVVREAENIIENYVRNRQMCAIENYYQLKEKYERLKILTVALLVCSCGGMLFHLLFS